MVIKCSVYLKPHQAACVLDKSSLPEMTPTMFTITLHAVCYLTWDDTHYVHNHPACCLPSYLSWHPLCPQSPCMLSAVLPEMTPTMSTITLHAVCCLTWDYTHYVHNHPACFLLSTINIHHCDLSQLQAPTVT